MPGKMKYDKTIDEHVPVGPNRERIVSLKGSKVTESATVPQL